MLFLHLHRSQIRPCSDVYSWRLISGGFLSCSEVTDRHFKPASFSAGPEDSDFTSAHRPSIQGAWSCRKGESGRENKHGSRKDALHEFPKNLKRQILQVGQRSRGGMWTMSMAWLFLSAYTVLLVGCFHTAVTENDVTPRLTFSYSKFPQLFDC